MKWHFVLLTALMLSACLALTGCQNAEVQATPPLENQDAAADIPEIQTPTAEPPASDGETSADKDSTSIDVDLTALSSTMVYAEVYNMMVMPEDYIGKLVKMEGQFLISQALLEDGTPIPDQIYYACVISDATACCAQGIEFLWSGEHSYPDDYPELGSEITVTGEFQTYEEYGVVYCQLINADVSYEE